MESLWALLALQIVGSSWAAGLPDGPLIVGYANWGECDYKIVEAAEGGVNVIVWFSIQLQKNGSNPYAPAGDTKPTRGVPSSVSVQCWAPGQTAAGSTASRSMRPLCSRWSMLLTVTLGLWLTDADGPKCASKDASELELTAIGRYFGATVHSPSMLEIISNPRLHSKLLEAFNHYGLLHFKNQSLSPAQEIGFMKLLPWDADAPPEKLYGPLGVPGVDEEFYRPNPSPHLRPQHNLDSDTGTPVGGGGYPAI